MQVPGNPRDLPCDCYAGKVFPALQVGWGPQENYFNDLRPFSKIFQWVQSEHWGGVGVFGPSTGVGAVLVRALRQTSRQVHAVSLHSRVVGPLWFLVHMEVHLYFSIKLWQTTLGKNVHRQLLESPGKRSHEIRSDFRELCLNAILWILLFLQVKPQSSYTALV